MIAASKEVKTTLLTILKFKIRLRDHASMSEQMVGQLECTSTLPERKLKVNFTGLGLFCNNSNKIRNLHGCWSEAFQKARNASCSSDG